jgi:hypothetical protein
MQAQRSSSLATDSEFRSPGLSILGNETSSGVSWAAIAAGAFVTAAFSLVLLSLGTGIGLSSISPWSNVGVSGPAARGGAIIWLIFVEIIASAAGGYLAGRLRTKWVNVHTDEVYFRDTAHGLLVWAVGLVITAAFLASAATTMVGGSTTSAPATADRAASRVGPNDYFVDSLLRSDHANPAGADPSMRDEVGVIFANGLRQGGLPDGDKAYLAGLVATRTGLGPGEAAQRVATVFANDQQTVDATRKAVAHSLYWLFLAFLIGAFSASFAATIGGKQRDHIAAI